MVDDEEIRGEDYPDGSPKTRIAWVRDEPHGLGRAWWPNGKPHWEVMYRRGGRHGELRVWYESGQLESVREYCDGKKHGAFVDYWESGAKAAEGRYERDVLVEIREWEDDTPIE